MSLKPSAIDPVTEETARIARAAFPKGNLYLAMRDELGIAFSDADFAELFPRRGQPAFSPWWLALITVLQFLENLSDRQAADAKYGIELFAPTRINSSWQSWTGGLDATQFEVDWDNRKVLCPAGKRSVAWLECQTKEPYSRRVVKVKFRRKDCFGCENRTHCVRSKTGAPRQLLLQAGEFHEALKETRAMFSSEAGRREYQQRADIEGTLSQGIRRGTVRRSRYIGLQKTHLQEVASAGGYQHIALNKLSARQTAS
jgi:transposase